MKNCCKILLPFFLSVRLLIAQNEGSEFNRAEIATTKNPIVENITVSDGLHHKNIYDVLHDRLGFLWLASGNGLQKYDGYTVTFYHPNSADSTFEEVFALYEDKHQNLWIQRKTGLSRYRRESDDFIAYDFVSPKNDTIPYTVFSIAEDLEGTLWAWVADYGLYKINLDANNFIPQEKVNRWFRGFKNQKILQETKESRIYETRITFPARHYGRKLQHKFVIKRKNGALEWERNWSPANPENGNREIHLLCSIEGDSCIRRHDWVFWSYLYR